MSGHTNPTGLKASQQTPGKIWSRWKALTLQQASKNFSEFSGSVPRHSTSAAFFIGGGPQKALFAASRFCIVV